jgi:hypothetical protein
LLQLSTNNDFPSNFVPKLTSIAQRVILRTKELNEENPLSVYPMTTFLAVDCANVKSVCETNKVEYYPSIQAVNFVNTNAKTKTRLEGNEGTILKFLGDTIFLVGN